MSAPLDKIPVTLSFDLGQFVSFFEQLPEEDKLLIVAILQKKITSEKDSEFLFEDLKNSVLKFNDPFEPAAIEAWDSLQ